MKEKLEQIRIDAVNILNSVNRLIDTVDLALQHFEDEPKGITNFEGVRDSDGRIALTWEGIPENSLDVQFQLNGKGKWHSVQWMLNDDKDPDDDDYNPPYLDGSMNLYVLPIPKGKSVKAELLEGYFDKEMNVFVAKKTHGVLPFDAIEESDEPSKIKHMSWGWWDNFMPDETLQDYPFANTLRTYADNVGNALETGVQYVIPTIGFGDIDNMSEYQIKKRLRYKGRHFEDETRDRIPYVIIQDEPDGWTLEQLELVIRLAEQEINPGLLYTYSFSGTYVLRERPLPQNAQLIHWNHYPFREKTYPSGWGYVDSKAKFMQTFDMAVEKVKRNMPDGVKLSMTTQTFAQKYHGDNWDGEWQWAHPHPESPIWYAEAMSKHDFVGGLHYLYKSDKSDVVAIDMPELMESTEKVYNEISK